jgi:hypothetical protein
MVIKSMVKSISDNQNKKCWIIVLLVVFIHLRLQHHYFVVHPITVDWLVGLLMPQSLPLEYQFEPW